MRKFLKLYEINKTITLNESTKSLAIQISISGVPPA